MQSSGKQDHLTGGSSSTAKVHICQGAKLEVPLDYYKRVESVAKFCENMKKIDVFYGSKKMANILTYTPHVS